MEDGVRPALTALAMAAVALTLGACGSDTSTVAQDPATTPATTTSSPTATVKPPHVGPACKAVWRDGADLAHSYRGCLDTSGWVKAQVYQCSDGHRVVTYAHSFYGQPGRTITKSSTTLVNDQQFRHLMALCGA